MHLKNHQKGILFASFTALLWGLLAIVIKLSLTNLRPLDVTWFRFALAFVMLFLYYAITDIRKTRIIIQPPPLLILAALFLGANYFGFISGIHLTTPSISQVFIQTGPVLFAVSGFLLYKEKITLRQGVGLLLVIAGMLVFYREQILVLAEDVEQYRSGVLWVLFGAVAWASFSVTQKKLVINHHPLQLNLVIYGLPALLFLPFVNLSAFAQVNWIEWLVLIFLGVNTLLAYGSLSFAMKYLEANKISVIIILNPILTFIIMAILGYYEVSWIVHDKFTSVTILGASIVITGAVLTVLKQKRKNSGK
jgi:drug/metabolite transporter (DMT)-like permease